MTRVRAPEPEDRGEWLRMRCSLWPDCPVEEHDAELVAFLAREEGRPPSSCLGSAEEEVIAFVADRPGGGLCGFVEASIRPYAEGAEARPIGYLEGWYVDPDARRRGIGRALVVAAEGWASSKGCRQMASDAELWNTVSHRAHGALGYEETGRVVLFKKDLGR